MTSNGSENRKTGTQMEYLLNHGNPEEREFALRHCIQGDLLDNLDNLGNSIQRIIASQKKNLRLRSILLRVPLCVYTFNALTSIAFLFLLITGRTTLTLALIMIAISVSTEGVVRLSHRLAKKSQQAYLTRHAEYNRLDAEYELLHSVMDTVR